VVSVGSYINKYLAHNACRAVRCISHSKTSFHLGGAQERRLSRLCTSDLRGWELAAVGMLLDRRQRSSTESVPKQDSRGQTKDVEAAARDTQQDY